MTNESPSGTRSLVVVSAGLSQPSTTRLLADRLADSVERQTANSVERRTIELRDHAQDLAHNLLTGFPSADLQASISAVLNADGLVAVSPIFNASYSGLFKSFFDVIEHDALRGMPVLIGATGGTPRHSLALEHALRPLFAYLGAAVVPTAVYAAAEDWGRGEMPADAGLADRIERAAGQLALAMTALPRPPVTDPFEDPTPFAQLLGGTEQRA
jgi:FMN reductase